MAHNDAAMIRQIANTGEQNRREGIPITHLSAYHADTLTVNCSLLRKCL